MGFLTHDLPLCYTKKDSGNAQMSKASDKPGANCHGSPTYSSANLCMGR